MENVAVPGAPPPTRLDVAIVALYPDSGHLVPLLKIGAMLAARGDSVRCLLPAECSTVAQSYGLRSHVTGTALSPIAIDAQRGFGARTILTASFDVYYQDYYAAIFANSVHLIRSILQELRARRPDLILVDNHQFSEVFAGIGAELSVPVVFHDSTGGLRSRTGSLAANLYGRPVSLGRSLGVLTFGSIYHLTRQVSRRYRFCRSGLGAAVSRARAEMGTLLTHMPPSARAHQTPGSAGAMSPSSRRMRYHIATGLALLEERVRDLPPLSDRHVFGPILDLPAGSLPSDLAGWLEAQPAQSVVYVSFGSMVTLAPDRLRTLVSALANLGCPVLWAQFGGECAASGDGMGGNVRIEQFVPQWSVLAHRAIGLCVTHGGVGTVGECIAAGVPLVVMPVMWDQPYNASLVDELGTGIRLDWWRLRPADLATRIRKVHETPIYRRRAGDVASELRRQNGSDAVAKYLETVVESGDSRSWR